MRRTLLIAALLSSACGGAGSGFDRAFTKKWQSDSGNSAGSLYQRLKDTQSPPAAQVAIGVTERGLVGMQLPGKATWSYDGKVDTVPSLSGSVAAFSSGHEVVALDQSSGKTLWKIDAGSRRLRGIGDDGSLTVVSLDDARGTEQSVLLVVARDGSIARRYELRAMVGVPAALGGVGFVPWDSQYVTALDLKSGDEIGRILLRHQVSQARSIGGDLYFGQLGMTRFDEAIDAAQRRGAHYVELPSKVLPGKPTWYGDGSVPATPSDSAATRIRVLARPTAEGDGLGIAQGIYASTYFSVALGLSAKDGSLAWVQAVDGDIVGGAAAKDGFVFCDENGKLWSAAGKSGVLGSLGELGSKLLACSVQVNSVGDAGTAPKSLAQQVEKLFENNLPELASAYSFVVDELPKVDDPLVTKILIDLIENPKTVPSVATRARVLLSSQRTGREYMLAALERHYDFLSGNRPPPVGPLADALAALEEPKAAPLLATQLNDPANDPGDIEKVARALHELAGASEVPELKTFFALYRATANEATLVDAVVLVADTLIKVGGGAGTDLVKQAARDPLTHPKVRQGLRDVLRPLERTTSKITTK